MINKLTKLTKLRLVKYAMLVLTACMVTTGYSQQDPKAKQESRSTKKKLKQKKQIEKAQKDMRKQHYNKQTPDVQQRMKYSEKTARPVQRQGNKGLRYKLTRKKLKNK
ncbi:MAG: hypothetical protein HC896_04685 [Bacteroidales bacterium]|nr:hypothetical protein [Bacteroidales bacterium]